MTIEQMPWFFLLILFLGTVTFSVIASIVISLPLLWLFRAMHHALRPRATNNEATQEK